MNAKVQAQAILLGGTVTYLEPEDSGVAVGDNFERAWAEGQAMTREQAIAFALEEDREPEDGP